MVVCAGSTFPDRDDPSGAALNIPGGPCLVPPRRAVLYFRVSELRPYGAANRAPSSRLHLCVYTPTPARQVTPSVGSEG